MPLLRAEPLQHGAQEPGFLKRVEYSGVGCFCAEPLTLLHRATGLWLASRIVFVGSPRFHDTNLTFKEYKVHLISVFKFENKPTISFKKFLTFVCKICISLSP